MLPVCENDDVQVDFMRRSHKVENKFYFPSVSDSHLVDCDDICAMLPNPISRGTTSRAKDCVMFPISFNSLNMG